MSDAPKQLEPVAWIRRWAFNKEVPCKEKNKNGRMVWPFKFKLVPLTATKALPDDEPLVAMSHHLSAVEKYADRLLAKATENNQLKSRVLALENMLQDSRDLYEQMEDTLNAARAVLSADPITHECLLAQCNQLLRSYDGAVGKPLATEIVGWQFYQDGKWSFGSEHHNHRGNTEAAGIPTRNVYAGCKVPNVKPVLSAAAFKKELLKATKPMLHPHIEGVYAVFELQQESQHD